MARSIWIVATGMTVLFTVGTASAEISSPRIAPIPADHTPIDADAAEKLAADSAVTSVEVFDFEAALVERQSTIKSPQLCRTPIPPAAELPEIEPISLQLVDAPASNAPASGTEASDNEPGMFIIPPAPECENTSSLPVEGLQDELFKPLSQVHLGGLSTSPPTTPDSEDVKLERPENIACAYIGLSGPAYYQTAPQIGMMAPHRTPYPFCHNPLYFEDPNLERCGRTNWCFTTVRSAGLFAGQIAALPLHVLIDCPRDHVRALPDCPTCYKFQHDAYCPLLR